MTKIRKLLNTSAMKTNKVIILLLGSFLLIAGYNFMSCKRPAKPKATVIVVDEEDKTVEGAQVVVRADSGRVIYLSSGMKLADTTLSGASGEVSYEFLYEAIYNVKVKTFKRVNGVTVVDKQGSGVLILKEDETYNEKIKIRP